MGFVLDAVGTAAGEVVSTVWSRSPPTILSESIVGRVVSAIGDATGAIGLSWTAIGFGVSSSSVVGIFSGTKVGTIVGLAVKDGKFGVKTGVSVAGILVETEVGGTEGQLEVGVGESPEEPFAVVGGEIEGQLETVGFIEGQSDDWTESNAGGDEVLDGSLPSTALCDSDEGRPVGDKLLGVSAVGMVLSLKEVGSEEGRSLHRSEGLLDGMTVVGFIEGRPDILTDESGEGVLLADGNISSGGTKELGDLVGERLTPPPPTTFCDVIVGRSVPEKPLGETVLTTCGFSAVGIFLSANAEGAEDDNSVGVSDRFVVGICDEKFDNWDTGRVDG